jgi:agmatine/peptidylarginine deiminase
MKRLIAEFEEQSFTQIIFPHAKTDWAEYLDEAQKTFVNIINAITKYQKCLVICDNIKSVKKQFEQNENLYFVEYETDDTWARDCSCLSVKKNQNIELLDFTFNGWGTKFDSSKDNAMSKSISKHYSKKVRHVDFILEGGAIEGNGAGTILTTSNCMLKRNKNLNAEETTQRVKKELGAKEILYLNHGYLAGDDTDSHIDTLARFANEKTVMYVACGNMDDEHYDELKLMEKELQKFANEYNLSLIALPMSEAIYYKDERLPATYANFLFVNGAVLVPTYNVTQDEDALKIFRDTFKERDVIGVDCSTLIRQHGSLHCVTMNFAKGVNLTLL